MAEIEFIVILKRQDGEDSEKNYTFCFIYVFGNINYLF